MKKIILFVCVFRLVLCYAAPPKWMLDAEEQFPPENFIAAVGEGLSESAAKKAALAELSAFFEQSIAAKINAWQEIAVGSSNNCENANVAQTVFAESRSELSCVRYAKSYFDKRRNRWSACAYIVKKDAWNVLAQKIDVVMSECAEAGKLARLEPRALQKIILLNKAKKYYDGFFGLYKNALVIYPARCEAFTAFAKKFARDFSFLSALKNKATITVFVVGDKGNKIRGKILDLLSQNGIAVASFGGVYELRANVDWNQSRFDSERGAIYSSVPQIEISINGKDGTTVSFAGKCEKVSAYNFETLERLALHGLETLLDERFILESFN